MDFDVQCCTRVRLIALAFELLDRYPETPANIFRFQITDAADFAPGLD